MTHVRAEPGCTISIGDNASVSSKTSEVRDRPTRLNLIGFYAILTETRNSASGIVMVALVLTLVLSLTPILVLTLVLSLTPILQPGTGRF